MNLKDVTVFQKEKEKESDGPDTETGDCTIENESSA